MDELKKQLISEAKEKYGAIFPCGEKKHINDCFTCEMGKLIFWFNTEKDTSTRALIAKIDDGG